MSNIALVKMNTFSKGIILLSNPAINTIRILFKNQPGNYTIDLYDNIGDKLKSETANIVRGEEIYTTGVKGLTQGIYYIKLMNRETREVTTLKVIIMN